MVHPNSEVEESVYEEDGRFLATFETNETETTTPGGIAPPLTEVVAEEEEDDENLSIFLPSAQ